MYHEIEKMRAGKGPVQLPAGKSGEGPEKDSERPAERTAAPGRKGFRCDICTGCGLCFGAGPGSAGPGSLHVLADRPLPGAAANSLFLHAASYSSKGGTRLAVADVGTTTVAMLLCGTEGSVEDRYLALNPQAAYGADVISRIRAAQDAEKAEDMRRRIFGVLEQGLWRFGKRLRAGEHIRLALTANTTMTYLLMGWDTSELGRAPFCASFLEEAETEIAGVPCFVFPGISAFVGGDVAAGMYACGMGEREDITLLIDLGTNGEIALGNCRRRIACATAAGPAFEGGPNKGVWGADMVSCLAALRREGLLDGTGLLCESCFRSGIRVGNVHVTQEAVRALQLAKGAVAAGIGVLLERYGIGEEQVDRVVLAGGFGYYLNPEDAAEIGLLTPKLAGKAAAGGNTALQGALRAGAEIACGQNPKGLRRLVKGTEALNLAEDPNFTKRYIEAINFTKAD